jgi:ABC-type multidrug transport system fused ATPase/permease subunit
MNMMMKPELRKFALTAHITASVGLLGSIAAFLALALAALVDQGTQIVRVAYPAMELTARSVIVPLAFASLITGVMQSLGTRWGLFRHYWVLAKLLLTLFATTVLLIKIELITYASQLAAEAILPRADLHAVGTELAVHAAGGLLVLLVPAALSVYKPQGLTPYGRRMQDEQVSPSQGDLVRSRQPDRNHDAGIRLSGKSIILTVPRIYVLGNIVVVLALHLVIFHLTSGGMGAH